MLSRVLAQIPPNLPVTTPVELTMIYGLEDSPITDYTWYVDKKFYRLTSIKVFHDNLSSFSPGFEVTFSADPIETSGWPDIVQMFNSDYGFPFSTIATFAYDLIEVASCVDDSTSIDADFESFKFKEEDLTVSMAGEDYKCTDGRLGDDYQVLPGRLIGFHVRTSLNEGVSYETITSIALIVD